LIACPQNYVKLVLFSDGLVIGLSVGLSLAVILLLLCGWLYCRKPPESPNSLPEKPPPEYDAALHNPKFAAHDPRFAVTPVGTELTT